MEADAKTDGPRLLPITSIDALLSWEPGSRPDDLFCRASVPLRIEEGDEEEDVRRMFFSFLNSKIDALSPPSLDPLTFATKKKKKQPSSPPSQRVLACHDFKGGYGDDALACGVFSPPPAEKNKKRGGEEDEDDDEGGEERRRRRRASGFSQEKASSSSCSLSPPSLSSSPFRFTHWNSVDAFVYFSHELVTLPPPGWTDAAHDAGVLCLGTLIFEHAGGLREAERAFGSAAAAEATAVKLAELSSWFGFDGWLFNVEVSFRREEEQQEGKEEGEGEGGVDKEERTRALIENCLLCLRRTRELCRSLSPASSSSSPPSSRSLVLWYDAVTCDDGSLRWQDGLTLRNLRYFSAADGIFTNYCWKGLEALRASARLAEEGEGMNRHAAEVWAGCDAFGRGSFGGAGGAGVAAAAPNSIASISSLEGGRLETTWRSIVPDPSFAETSASCTRSPPMTERMSRSVAGIS